MVVALSAEHYSVMEVLIFLNVMDFQHCFSLEGKA